MSSVVGVVAERVGDDVGHRLRRELMLALKMRGSDGRQRHHPGNGREVSVGFNSGVEIGRYEHDSVHGHAELRLQIVGHARTAEASVAFAYEIFARTEAVVLDEPVVDDAREIFDVGRGAVEELLGFVLGDERAAEAGSDGIDENQIGEVEPGSGIVGERGRIGGAVSFIAGSEMLRADGSEVEEDRRCAGAAVDGEGYGAVCAVDGVGGVNDLPSLLAVAVADGQRADGDGVMQRLAVQLNALLRRARRAAEAAVASCPLLYPGLFLPACCCPACCLPGHGRKNMER